MDYEKIRREYIHEPLTLDVLDENPMVVFQQWFDEAYKYFGSDTNAMSLATASKKGRPSVRTVLLKGVTKRGFLFYTNYNSRKGEELSNNPVAALLFYWLGLDRQVRIEGPVSKVSDDLSEAYFRSRPHGSQISAAASPQSKKITLDELNERRLQFADMEHVPRPDDWGGFELTAQNFEFWNGRENRFHDRFLYELNSTGRYDRYRIAP